MPEDWLNSQKFITEFGENLNKIEIKKEKTF